jgi:hypothetical protein
MNANTLSDARIDLQVVADLVDSGQPLDPELVRRVQDRAKKAREELERTIGKQDIGVDLIREGRDEIRH